MQNSPKLQQQAKAELAKRELARRHLKSFAEYVYEGYLPGWHTDVLCAALEKIEKGEIRFLMVEMPPRHGKSLHVSQLFPAWCVGRDKDASVIVSSYSGDLATDHGRETRNLMASKRYQNVFSTRLAADSTAKGKWNTDGKGAYNAVGVGGSTTGRGAKYFIVDDPLKDRKEAESELIRDDRWAWFRSVARTRLTPDGAMIVMHTRWHLDDLIGRIIKEDTWRDYFAPDNGEKWVRLRLPAIATESEKYRKSGEPLWPERYNVAELDDIKKTIGTYEWGALYQQNPVLTENQEFKPSWFRYRTLEDVSHMSVRKFATIDPNLKKSDTSDWTGVCRNYVNEKNQWHLRANRYRVNSKDIIDLIFLLHDEGFEKIGIEEGAFTYVVEPFLKDEMTKRGKFPNIVPLKHQGTMKEIRIRGLIPRYQTEMIYHLEGECDDLEEELLSFPLGLHDDCADAVAYQIQIAEQADDVSALIRESYYDHQEITETADRYGL